VLYLSLTAKMIPSNFVTKNSTKAPS